MSKYSNGYWPKIQYWTGKMNEAIQNSNLEMVDRAHRKLDYFIQCEWDSKVVVKKDYSIDEIVHLGRS